MVIKRYLVRSMNEAMVRIRYELGSKAVIVSSRWIHQKGLRNLFKPKILEVTAAVDRSQEREPKTGESAEAAAANEIVPKAPAKDTVSVCAEPKAASGAGQKAAVQTEGSGKDEGRIEKELKELKSLVSMLMEKNQGLSEEKAYADKVIEHLTNMEVDEEIINSFASFSKNDDSRQPDPQEVQQYFDGVLAGSILNQKIEERIWALVGPTGVGKTTTIAKIAAQELLNNKKSVGLITLDTYRIGAVEQLKTYAGILSIPLEVVFTKADLISALDKLKDCDLILIDSTGRNSYDKEQLLETRDLLNSIEHRRNILVISAATRKNDLKAIIENYSYIGFDSVILTKLDETQYYGNILNFSKYTDKPLCYITTGQVVPDDIKEASEANLLDYVLMGVQA